MQGECGGEDWPFSGGASVILPLASVDMVGGLIFWYSVLGFTQRTSFSIISKRKARGKYHFPQETPISSLQ